MLITVDLDYDDFIKVKTDILIGLDYQLKPVKIVKSPSKKGYHIVWRTHKARVENLDFILEASEDTIEIVKQRLRIAELLSITEKEYILRVVLGDDIFRVIYDIKRKDIMPQQVLFSKSNYYRRYNNVKTTAP